VSRLAVIAAVAENGVIGRENGLPWRLPEDLRHFKRITMGKPVIMGRRTWDSIGRPLPGRTNIVISRNPDCVVEGILVVASLEEALARAGRIAAADGVEEAVVIGGAEIYRAAIPRADRLYITEVHVSVEGDTRLPAIDWRQWREVSREYHTGELDYSFVRYERDSARTVTL